MGRKTQTTWVMLSPSFPEDSAAKQVFRAHGTRLSELLNEDRNGEKFNEAIQESLRCVGAYECGIALRAALYVLTDLARQRWSIRSNEDGDIEVRRPQGDRLDPMSKKARIREQELVKRDEQLQEPAARRFIRGMEKKSLHDGRLVSIYSVIREGRELAESLRAARSLQGDERIRALRDTIEPYLQFVDEAEYCEHTGLRLQDVWRYFRHTWTNQYTATPGRSMAFIVRDRAREHHPVIGIGSLGSPIVQIRERDSWIGWQPEAFIEFASESPSAELGTWLHKIVETAIAEIYLDDFFEEELLSPNELRAPTPEVLQRLIAHGERQRVLHHRLASSSDLKRSLRSDNTGSTEAHWRARARTHLYRSKRARSLADMLRSRIVLQQHLSMPPTREEVRTLLDARTGRRIVKKILRKAKADRVGVAMADITVCGAVAPYNLVLGGKLVSMLSVSPEVVSAYREKYAAQESEIASSMAGRPIVRRSELVFLGTTSLYGVGSSQYNRLRMKAERIGANQGEQLAFLEIGKSEAYGTSQFGSETVRALVSLVQQSRNGQRVNSIFGEGVSPKLRKIRDGLDTLNLPADVLLKHGRQRIVYGVPVARNVREFLLGMDDEPEYVFDLDEPERSTREIGLWWAERWLRKRIESDDILAGVEQHTLVRPIRHGARVVLPCIDDGGPWLFDDLAG